MAKRKRRIPSGRENPENYYSNGDYHYDWNLYKSVRGGKIGNTRLVYNGHDYGVKSLITGKVFGAGYTKSEAKNLAKRFLDGGGSGSSGG